MPGKLRIGTWKVGLMFSVVELTSPEWIVVRLKRNDGKVTVMELQSIQPYSF